MTPDSQYQNNNNKKKNKNIGFALILVLLGVLYLSFNLGLLPSILKPILISWQMLLIVIGVWSLIKRNYVSGVVLLAIGTIFLSSKLGGILPFPLVGIHFNFTTYWPIILIVIGLLVIQKRAGGFCGRKNISAKQNDAEYIEQNLLFSGGEQIILSENFKGGKADIMFGELILDLRKAKLAEGDNKLDINVMFGNIVILVPSDWHIELNGTSVFGGFEDKRYNIDRSAIDNTARLILNVSCMFAGGELKKPN